jgi:hypothetical protein
VVALGVNQQVPRLEIRADTVGHIEIMKITAGAIEWITPKADGEEEGESGVQEVAERD